MTAIDVKKMVRKHGALVSGVAAASVAGFVLLQRITSDVIGLVSVLPLTTQTGAGDAWPLWSIAWPAVVVALPFGIGFFVSLWLVAPIAAELRVGHVISRAVLATGIASTVVFIVLAIGGLINAFSPSGGSLAGYQFPWPAFSGASAAFALGQALQQALQILIGMLPLGVLAGVLLWLWRKDNPPKHPLAGYIDEI